MPAQDVAHAIQRNRFDRLAVAADRGRHEDRVVDRLLDGLHAGLEHRAHLLVGQFRGVQLRGIEGTADRVRGGEREHIVATAVGRRTAGAAQAHHRARGDATQVAVAQRRIGGDDDDDGTVPAVVRQASRTVGVGRHCVLECVTVKLAPDRRTRHLQHASEIGLHQRAHRPSAQRCGQPARGGADTALPAERHGAGARPHAAFLHGAAAGRLQRAPHRLGGDGARADVVEPPIVGLTDHHVERPYLLHVRTLQHPRRHRIRGLPHAQGAGQHDGRFQFAQFVHLGAADELAEAVADMHGGRHPRTVGVAGMRQDRGDAGAHGVAFHQGHLADAHARHVGDRVVRAGGEDARRHAEIACTRAGRVLREGAGGNDGQQQRRQPDRGTVRRSRHADSLIGVGGRLRTG